MNNITGEDLDMNLETKKPYKFANSEQLQSNNFKFRGGNFKTS